MENWGWRSPSYIHFTWGKPLKNTRKKEREKKKINWAAPIKRHQCEDWTLLAGWEGVRLSCCGWWWVPRVETRELINIQHTVSDIRRRYFLPPPHLHLSLSLIQLYISSLSLLSLLKREKEIRKTTWIDKKTKRIPGDDRAESWCPDVIITYYRWIGSSGWSLERRWQEAKGEEESNENR